MPRRTPLVSPALRGDGRENDDVAARLLVFPPRYAGMEGYRHVARCEDSRFPRATRGWKEAGSSSLPEKMVSPALRGDGRARSLRAVRASAFPPRYAGMEGGRRYAGRCS